MTSGASAPEPGPAAYRRVLLVGFMGSGKTTVGRKLARILGWEFVDFDDVVEARSGHTISEIFRRDGEQRFRELEAVVASELLRRRRVVLASGGGWPATRGRMEALDEDTLSVWLRVSPEEAVRRVRAEGPGRPLLDGERPLERAAELLERRREHYALARLALDTEAQEPDELARRVAGEVTGGTPARRDAERNP